MRIELKWLSDLIQTMIHSNSSENNIEDYMLPSISELQPRIVSWSANNTKMEKGSKKMMIMNQSNMDVDAGDSKETNKGN